jgi:hypothetical protein
VPIIVSPNNILRSQLPVRSLGANVLWLTSKMRLC